MGFFELVIVLNESETAAEPSVYVASSLIAPLLSDCSPLGEEDLVRGVSDFCGGLACESAVGWRLRETTFGFGQADHVLLAVGRFSADSVLEEESRDAAEALSEAGSSTALKEGATVICIVATSRSIPSLSVVLPIAARVLALHPTAFAWTQMNGEVAYANDVGWVEVHADIDLGRLQLQEFNLDSDA